MRIGLGSILVAALLLLSVNAAAHGIGEPELEASVTFQACCHGLECRHYPMVRKGKSAEKALVWIKGLGNVVVPVSTLKDEKVSYPVLCTHNGDPPAAGWDAETFMGNIRCLFFPKRHNAV